MEPIQRAVTVCQELSRIFKSRQCIMSRVVTNRGRQRFRVAVDGESLSDDLKNNSQGRNPRIREERAVPNAGKRAGPTGKQRRESVMAVRRLECETKLQSGETQFW